MRIVEEMMKGWATKATRRTTMGRLMIEADSRSVPKEEETWALIAVKNVDLSEEVLRSDDESGINPEDVRGCRCNVSGTNRIINAPMAIIVTPIERGIQGE